MRRLFRKFYFYKWQVTFKVRVIEIGKICYLMWANILSSDLHKQIILLTFVTNTHHFVVFSQAHNFRGIGIGWLENHSVNRE